MNLLSSFADDDEDDEGEDDNDEISVLEDDVDSGDWLGEYRRGKSLSLSLMLTMTDSSFSVSPQ